MGRHSCGVISQQVAQHALSDEDTRCFYVAVGDGAIHLADLACNVCRPLHAPDHWLQPTRAWQPHATDAPSSRVDIAVVVRQVGGDDFGDVRRVRVRGFEHRDKGLQCLSQLATFAQAHMRGLRRQNSVERGHVTAHMSRPVGELVGIVLLCRSARFEGCLFKDTMLLILFYNGD